MGKIITTILLIAWILFSCFYSNIYLISLKETTYLWFTIIIPSVLPMYVASNFLIGSAFLFLPVFKSTKPLFHFENIFSCMIFFVSLICGNPTVTYLISDSITNNLISKNEGDRLMRSTCHLSPIFIWILSEGMKNFCLLIISLWGASGLILLFSKNKESNSKQITNTNYFTIFNKIIDNGPNILLKILIVMILIGFFKTFITYYFDKPFFSYLLAYLEVTMGCNFFKSQNLNLYWYDLLITTLLSTTGLSIIFQTINAGKKQINIKNFLKFRFIHLIISTTILTTFYFLIY